MLTHLEALWKLELVDITFEADYDLSNASITPSVNEEGVAVDDDPTVVYDADGIPMGWTKT